jgi:hypothetical protein
MPLIHGLYLSKLRYALPVFAKVRMTANEPQTGTMKKLQVAMNNMIRIVTSIGKKDKVSVKKLLEIINLPSVNQLAAECILMECYKIIKHKIEPLASILSPRQNQGTSATTRAQTHGYVQLTQHWDDTTFVFQAKRLWNWAPMSFKEAKNITTARNIAQKISQSLPI